MGLRGDGEAWRRLSRLCFCQKRGMYLALTDRDVT